MTNAKEIKRQGFYMCHLQVQLICLGGTSNSSFKLAGYRI